MSLVALKFLAALLLLQMHACNARHTFDLVSYTKVVDAGEKTKLVHHEIDLKGSHIFEDIMYTSSDDLSIATLENNSRPSKEMQGLFKVKARSMLESKSHDETKQPSTSDANEGESVEDAVVMDYVHPHRKSPIHNHH
ncbi:uncharacterized protein LOC110732251 [Chenopodium quinoa]|uniref:uncharacterized protein LOC110732251 n=1 Tax=Chenopodium quinoa TaxID=63459 RepID=UPI000B76FA04|nr:uncharacterized protein LOC110732251 [Chenopodium quinoa]